MKIPVSLVRAREALVDGLEALLRRRGDLVPPRRLSRWAGTFGEFVEVGEELTGIVVDHGELSPQDRLLDLGCGCGRLAVPLTRYLSPEGSYEGIDVMAPAVRWCRRRITPRFGNFSFHHLDLHNSVYNPAGKLAASELELPFDDASFDVAVLTSVFTHLLGPGFDRYVSELARVLRPGGRMLATYFLLNEESERMISEGRTLRSFPHDLGTHRVEGLEKPERTVAFKEAHVRARYAECGLAVREPVAYGKWPGRRTYLTFQDLVVAVRMPEAAADHGKA